MSGRLINDHKFWAGSKSKDSVFPKGVHLKDESSASSSGHLNEYEDTTEKIKRAQDENTKKVRAHSNPPMYRQ
jgi:hypothetical protein